MLRIHRWRRIPALRASNTNSVSMSWRCDDISQFVMLAYAWFPTSVKLSWCNEWNKISSRYSTAWGEVENVRPRWFKWCSSWLCLDSCIIHYNAPIMGTMASQIISLIIVYSSVYSGADQGKHQSSASLALCGELVNHHVRDERFSAT